MEVKKKECLDCGALVREGSIFCYQCKTSMLMCSKCNIKMARKVWKVVPVGGILGATLLILGGIFSIVINLVTRNSPPDNFLSFLAIVSGILVVSLGKIDSKSVHFCPKCRKNRVIYE